jgi:hypothetical protein
MESSKVPALWLAERTFSFVATQIYDGKHCSLPYANMSYNALHYVRTSHMRIGCAKRPLVCVSPLRGSRAFVDGR